MIVSITLHFLLLTNLHATNFSCSNKIYCEGNFFEHMVQTDSLLYKAMMYPESVIVSNFEGLLRNTSNRPTYSELIEFRDQHFVDETVDVTVLKDYYASWTFVEKIVSKSQIVGDVTRNLVSSWNDFAVNGTMARKFPEEQYSLISPREFINTKTELESQCTYWDHYWIVNGLIASNMCTTALSLIQNLISMVKAYGMVPAANRIFYVGRSNPPLLTPMAYNYFMATKRQDWLSENIPHLDRELSFWVKHRYHSNITGPRPEMYKLDTAFAEGLVDKESIYRELNTLTETGGGITDRWVNRQKNRGLSDISSIKPSNVIPVDLNSFLYRGFACLSELYKYTGNDESQKYWARKATKLLSAISTALWNDTETMWYDFHLETKRHRRVFFISNLMPIWAHAFDVREAADKIDMVLMHMQNYSILSKLEVQIPVSAARTGLIWDYPAAVSKLEAMVMEGFAELLESNSRNYFNTTMANILRGITDRYLAIKRVQQQSYANILYVDRSKSPVIGSYIKLIKNYYNIRNDIAAGCNVRLFSMVFLIFILCILYYV